MKSFQIPELFRSTIIARIKQYLKEKDPRRKDMTPVFVDFGPVGFYIARHFGFCYGVENAIEISYKAISENPNKKIYLLSQMIHNDYVNRDLTERGVKFLQDTNGKQIIPFEELTPDDVVIIPAFGTTLEIENLLLNRNIEVKKYNTTCPFVERVWKKSETLGDGNYTVIIHGKYQHEETRATFSRSKSHSKTVIVKDMKEAIALGKYILKDRNENNFIDEFKDKFSEGFDASKDLERIGVINQTTMLASETTEIANYFKKLMKQKYGEANIKDHFADTHDTLCYATNENQDSTFGLLKTDADIAIVVGGYNSSNTSHLVELLEKQFTTYFIVGESDVYSKFEINHWNYSQKTKSTTKDFLLTKQKLKIILTSGASCPDAVLENVMRKIIAFYPIINSEEDVMKAFN